MFMVAQEARYVKKMHRYYGNLPDICAFRIYIIIIDMHQGACLKGGNHD